VKFADNLVNIRAERKPQKSLSVSFDEEDSFEYIRIDGRVILMWILKN
jgi:hypothetical protein